jgi:hypothetical protein
MARLDMSRLARSVTMTDHYPHLRIQVLECMLLVLLALTLVGWQRIGLLATALLVMSLAWIRDHRRTPHPG